MLGRLNKVLVKIREQVEKNYEDPQLFCGLVSIDRPVGVVYWLTAQRAYG